jgi:hypothetical protein
MTSLCPATTIDLQPIGSKGTLNGAWFYQIDPDFQVGTGNLRPFLQVQSSSYERGYNTDGDPGGDVDMAINTGSWTHSVLVGDVSQSWKDGQYYKEFFVDVNESGKVKSIDLTQLRIHVVDSPTGATLVNYPPDQPGQNEPADYGLFGEPVWDMDLGDSTNTVIINADGGSGDGDMLLLVPTSLFPDPTDNLILYCRFDQSSDGFEEWAISSTPILPEPTTLAMVVLGGGGMVLKRSKKGLKKPATRQNPAYNKVTALQKKQERPHSARVFPRLDSHTG